MSDCVFCKIAAGELPAHKVYENDDVLAIADVGHVNPGHTLVIVKAHAPTLMDLDEAQAAKAFGVANRVAKAVEKAFAPGGITILHANRPAAWQTVFHFHLHVLPRHDGDGVELVWPAKNPPADELAANAEKVRAAMED